MMDKMNSLKGIAVPSAGSSVKEPKETTPRQPFLHLCKVIDDSAPILKDILAERLKQKLKVDENKFSDIEVNIYNLIVEKTRDEYVKLVDSFFTVGRNQQDVDNTKISVLIVSKNNYEKSLQEDEKNIFSETYPSYDKFQDALDAQFDKYLDKKRGESTKVVGGFPSGLNGIAKGIPSGLTEMAKGFVGQTGITTGPNVDAGKQPGQSKQSKSELEKSVDKVYGKHTFQKKIEGIIISKIDKLVKNKDGRIQTIMTGATTKIADKFDEMMEKFIVSIDDRFFNLCIIKSIFPEYISNYFNNSEKSNTIGDYIESLVSKKEYISGGNTLQQVPAKGGKRKTNHRKSNRREYKRIRPTHKRPSKNIA